MTLLRTLSLACLTLPAAAQIEYGGAPASTRLAFAEPAATAELPALDMLALGARVAAEPADGAFRFGEVIPTERSIDTDGSWQALANGDRVWRLRLASRGAFSLMLTFSRFRLPEGGELFVYDDEREFVRGAYTHLNNRLDGRFAIQPVPGEGVTLEYYHPRGAERPELTLASVVHDYTDSFGYAQLRNGGLGASEACEVDIACPEGTGWGEQAKSVVQITGSTGICCSGVLMNNTAGDGAALVLTAAHCLNIDDAVFTFNFDRPSCGSGAPPTTDTVMGSRSLVMDETLDFNLVRLDTAPPASYDVRMAGWDRTDVLPTNTVGIHHPRGDAKKISIDVDPPTKNQSFWNLANWETGVTEGGSSGSPLFEPVNQRVIGHLIMGASLCVAPVNDFYGRVSERWELLAPYLDPLNTGQLTTDILDPATLPPPTFSVSGFLRDVHPLSPGTRPDQALSGAGFSPNVQVSVDGTALVGVQAAFQGSATVQLDLPLLDIGPHMLTVTDGGNMQTLSFDVVAPPGPVFQVGSGNIGQSIFSFVPTDFTYVGTPGEVQMCLFSADNTPSVLPGIVSLAIGGNFTDLRNCLMVTIPVEGHFTRSDSLTGLAIGVEHFGQTITLGMGAPIPVSNLQSGTRTF